MKPFEDFQSGVDPQIIASREKQVDDFNEIPDNFEKDLRNNVPNIDTQLSGARGVSKTTVNDPMATPGGSGILNYTMFDNSSINLGTR